MSDTTIRLWLAAVGSLLLGLAGCRSEHLAFQSRPAPVVSQPSTSKTVVAATDALRRPPATLPSAPLPRRGQQAPVAARRQPRLRRQLGALVRQLPLPVAQPAGPGGPVAAVAKRHQQPRAAQGWQRHRSPAADDSLYAVCFFAGLILVGLGILTLLVGVVGAFLFLPLPAGLLVLLGLGGVALGVLLAMFGWAGDGHWSFG